MSPRRTLEQALPITPWQQALRGLRASQTTSLWGGWGGTKTGRRTRIRKWGKGGAGGALSEVSASRPLQSYLDHGGAELGSYGLCARRPRPWPPLAPVGLRRRACHPIDRLPEPPGLRPQC